MCGLSLVMASRGYSLVEVLGLLITAASHCRAQALAYIGFSSCGTWAQLPHGMWNLPRPGIEPVSLALGGGFLTTKPPGKSSNEFCCNLYQRVFCLDFPLIVF